MRVVSSQTTSKKQKRPHQRDFYTHLKPAEASATLGWRGCLPNKGNWLTRRTRWQEHEYSQNHHPTVKPIELMRYLVRLTKTPTGGVVLDPFTGSGTTGIACVLEGREFIGIEREGGVCRDSRKADCALQVADIGRGVRVKNLLDYRQWSIAG